MLALLVSACSSSRRAAMPGPGPSTSATPITGRPGGTLTVVGAATRAELDPGAATDDASRLLGRLVYRQLYSYAPTTSVPQPDLAIGPPQLLDAGRTVRIRLRQDARWNVPAQRRVASGDVVRGLKRLCLPGRSTAVRGYLGQLVEGYALACQRLGRAVRPTAAAVDALTIPGLLAVGDDQVELRLLRPAPDLVGVLAQPAASPVPAELAAPTAPSDRQDITQLVGDGPYRFQAPEAGETYRLTRNPSWDPSSDPLRQALADRVVMRGGLDAAAVSQQITSGAADLSWDVSASPDSVRAATRLTPPDAASSPPAVPGAAPVPAGPDVAVTPGRTVTLLAAGSDGPAATLMQSPAVRSALAACVDRDAVAAALGGGSTPLAELVPPDVAATGDTAPADGSATASPTGSPTAGRGSARPTPTATPTARASARPGSSAAAAAVLCRAALQAAQVPTGTTLVLQAKTNDPARHAARALSASLATAGVRLRVIDAGTQTGGSPAGSSPAGWDLALLQVQPSPTGARGELAPLLDPRWPGSPGLPTLASLAQGQSFLDGLTAALATSDSTQRTQAVESVVQAVQADAALVPLAETPTRRLVGPHLSVAPVLAVLGNVDPVNAALDVTRPRTDPRKSLQSATPTP